MRDLVAEDGHGGRHAGLGRRGEGRPDDQAVGKVVEAVAHGYHHSQQRNPSSWAHKSGVCVAEARPHNRDECCVAPGDRVTLCIAFICVVRLVFEGHYSVVEGSFCQRVQVTPLHSPSRPLVPAG